MKSLFFKQKILLLQVFILLLGTACSNIQRTTTAEVTDPIRHYYPIIQGQELKILYEIFNTGEGILRIDEIQTSCGCIVIHYPNVVPVGKSGFVAVTYESNKNIGLVDHYMYIYGNFEDKKPMEINFDVHVVPDAHYTKDYEELYEEEIENSGKIDEDVETRGPKYYTDKEE